MGYKKIFLRLCLKLKTPKPKNMKKVLLVLAVAGVMVACNNKKKEAKDTKNDTTTTTDKMDKMDNTTTVTVEGVPTFSNAEVQAYANDYAVFVDAYVDAYKTKDATKIQAVSAKMMDWSTRSMEVAKKLGNNPEEARKFSDWITMQSQRLADAAKAMYP